MRIRLATAALLALLLTGCAGFSYDPSRSVQDYAGCTVVDYRSADGAVIDYKDCKDKSQVVTTLTMPNGAAFSYNAYDVTGLEHMRLRAEVHRALTDAGVTVTGDAIDAIIRALRPAP
jgi:hypothetical protein